MLLAVPLGQGWKVPRGHWEPMSHGEHWNCLNTTARAGSCAAGKAGKRLKMPEGQEAPRTSPRQLPWAGAGARQQRVDSNPHYSTPLCVAKQCDWAAIQPAAVHNCSLRQLEATQAARRVTPLAAAALTSGLGSGAVPSGQDPELQTVTPASLQVRRVPLVTISVNVNADAFPMAGEIWSIKLPDASGGETRVSGLV